jgi:hypothetical protein
MIAKALAEIRQVTKSRLVTAQSHGFGRITHHFHEKAGAVNCFLSSTRVREIFPPEPPVASRNRRNGAE